MDIHSNKKSMSFTSFWPFGENLKHRVLRGKTMLVPRPNDMWILAK
jgi:hypothetical protein